MEAPLSRKVRGTSRLWSAWKTIQANGQISKSLQTRKEVQQFSLNVEKSIGRLHRQLRSGTFRFQPAVGIAQRREGKSSRPIVKSCIEDRIVQRSILDVLQNEPSVQPYFLTESSFGGIKGRGVKPAVAKAIDLTKSGATYFLRSDIQAFFTKIPKPTVFDRLFPVTRDPIFNELFKAATDVELANMEALGADADLFPLYDIGVAQGCCLSPFIGNVLLHDFDVEMNRGDIACLRYIDDFLILGPNKKAVMAAFKRATKALARHGLSAYDPMNSPGKAEMGEIKDGYEFLGCRVSPGLIRPADKSKRRLLDSLEEIFSESERLLHSAMELSRKKKTFIETLIHADRVLQGWGNQYSFCNNDHFLEAVDNMVHERIKQYMKQYYRAVDKASKHDKQRLLGVHLLVDSKKEPIIGARTT